MVVDKPFDQDLWGVTVTDYDLPAQVEFSNNPFDFGSEDWKDWNERWIDRESRKRARTGTFGAFSQEELEAAGRLNEKYNPKDPVEEILADYLAEDDPELELGAPYSTVHAFGATIKTYGLDNGRMQVVVTYDNGIMPRDIYEVAPNKDGFMHFNFTNGRVTPVN